MTALLFFLNTSVPLKTDTGMLEEHLRSPIERPTGQEDSLLTAREVKGVLKEILKCQSRLQTATNKWMSSVTDP